MFTMNAAIAGLMLAATSSYLGLIMNRFKTADEEEDSFLITPAAVEMLERQKRDVAAPQTVALHLDSVARQRLRNLDANYVRFGLQEVNEGPSPPPTAMPAPIAANLFSVFC